MGPPAPIGPFRDEITVAAQADPLPTSYMNVTEDELGLGGRRKVAAPATPAAPAPTRRPSTAVPPAAAAVTSYPAAKASPKSMKGVDDRALSVYDALRGGGLSHNQAAAFLGHAEYESAIGQTTNPEEGAAGLIHWRGDRLDRLKEFARSRGESGIGSVTTQAEFAIREMTTDPYESGQAARFLDSPDAPVDELARLLRPYIRYGTKTDGQRAKLGSKYAQQLASRLPPMPGVGG
jgi:hypothetical protein